MKSFSAIYTYDGASFFHIFLAKNMEEAKLTATRLGMTEVKILQSLY